MQNNHYLLFFFSIFFTEAAACLVKAVEIYTDMGRFTIAAKHHQVRKI
jgi:hypothetical protein